MKKLISIIMSILLFGCALSGCSNNASNNGTTTTSNSNGRNTSVKADGTNEIISEKLATPENPVLSPSGKYLLEIVQGYNGVVHYNRFVVSLYKGENIDPEVVFCSKDTFRTRDRLYFMWYETTDSIYVYSGDTGSYRWDMESDEVWVKHSNLDEVIEEPELMKELRDS